MSFYVCGGAKLKCVDDHPDNFDGQPEHKMNVENLRKALRFMGHDIREFYRCTHSNSSM